MLAHELLRACSRFGRHCIERESSSRSDVMRVGKFPKAFRQMAVDRLKQCENIVALAKELGIHRRLFNRWRDQLEPAESGEGPPL